jgi:hypothetical protein
VRDLTTTPEYQLGRYGEKHVKELLESHGAVILYSENFSKLGAPKINNTILPDFYEFKASTFVEIKTKCTPTFYRKTQQDMFGVGIRHYDQYCKIAEMTMKEVWIVFLSLRDHSAHCCKINDTPIHHRFVDPSRLIKGVDQGGMLFFAIDDLYPFSTLLGRLEAK